MSKRILERGKPLEELVKGSLQYTAYAIRQAFRQQFKHLGYWDYWVEEIFAEYVIVKGEDQPADEYYHVPYQPDGESYTFADEDDWEVVELAYQPRTSLAERRGDEGTKFTESLSLAVHLLDEAKSNTDGPWRIEAVGSTAGVVNGNDRRYAAPVLDAAVQELRSHLHESAGQGRALQLYGESEHPSMKPTRRPFLAEVVVNWDRVAFDGQQILIEGNLLGTTKGKDIRAQMLGGVVPGVSQRAYGGSHFVEEDGREIEEVDWLVITGYDLTVEPSDPVAGVTMFESKRDRQPNQEPDREEVTEMKLNLELLKEKYPELVEQLLQEHDEEKKKAIEEKLQRLQAEEERSRQQLAERQAAERDAQLRQALGVEPDADLVEAARQHSEKLAELEESQRQRLEELTELQEAETRRQVAEHVAQQIGEIGYPDWLQEQLTGAVEALEPATVEDADRIIEAKRKEYDAIMAKVELAAQGHGGVRVLGPVLERETGVPEFARFSFQLLESLVASGFAPRRDMRQPKSVNEQFAARYLALFDKTFKHHLVREARLLEEAEQTTDLSLPYTVSRAVVAEAFPRLIATSVFDVGIAQSADERVYYETYAGETGASASVTDEAVTSDEGAWVSLANAHVQPGTVVVEPDGGGTAFTEGTDYVIDYLNGKLFTIAAANGGTIGDSTALDVDYTYYAYRKGEMTAIERGKMSLSYTTLTMAADRLATQISKEAIVFSRSQIGWDAVARTLSALVRQIQRAIDEGLLYLALAAALRVASNSGGTWTAASDPLVELVEKIGTARVKVGNRYYEPTAILMSLTNSDRVSNWDGFSAAGTRPDADLNANGYVGRLKGLPVFESTEFSDGYVVVCNRQVVLHRVFRPMELIGPFPSYDVSGGTSKLIAADQYYAEEFNGSDAPVPEKASYVKVA